MTTAARPTFDPAKGGRGVKDRGIGKLSQLLSSRDLPAHETLKARLPGQDTTEELKKRDLRAELEEREKIAQIERSKPSSYKYVPSLEQATQVRLAIKAERDKEREEKKEALLGNESVIDEDELSQGLPTIVNARKMAQLDQDEDFGSDDFSESDFTDDDDDGDDPEELMAELNRIKQERLAEEEKREKEQREREDKIRSNYDDETASNFSIKRRWDDDVPFKNCARASSDPKKKLYINDTLRREFHKKFMNKYIK